MLTQRSKTMSPSISCALVCLFALCLTIAGCGRGRLQRLRVHKGCPWCGPGKQVQDGHRSMGKSFYGDIWKIFWRDPSGREYDPEKVAEQAWNYLKKTGDVAKIEEARRAGKCSCWMRIVSVNPTVVLMIPCQHQRFAHLKTDPWHGTSMAIELAHAPDMYFYFDEPM